MAKLGELITRQLKKLGIEITEELKPLIEADVEVPEEVAKKLDTGLLTIEAAKTNQEVLKFIRQTTLGSADNRMDDIIKELGITMGDDFVNEKNTYEKIALLSKAILAEGVKKGTGSSKESVSDAIKKERDEWVKKEADFQKQLKDISESLTNKENEFKTTRENDLTTFELHKILLGKDYVFPKEMDSSIKVQTALAAINKDLKTKGYTAKLNEAGTIVIVDKDGNKAYTEKHEAIDNADSYFDGVLTQQKLLTVNDTSQQQQQQGGQGSGTVITGGGAKGNQAIVAEIDQQLFQ